MVAAQCRNEGQERVGLCVVGSSGERCERDACPSEIGVCDGAVSCPVFLFVDQDPLHGRADHSSDPRRRGLCRPREAARSVVQSLIECFEEDLQWEAVARCGQIGYDSRRVDLPRCGEGIGSAAVERVALITVEQG